MTEKIVVNPTYSVTQQEIEEIFKNYHKINGYIAKGKRNTIKKTTLKNGNIITIKAFRIPNVINKIVYRFFRPSKAERSYNYAKILIEKGIKTPYPIAYIESTSALTFLDSYYFCELTDADFTYREVVNTPNFPDFENVLRQFTRFTFKLHEAGIEFLDHSPGNTLIVDQKDGTYEFYLVDLNRMKFHNKMSLDQRIQNFTRLSAHFDSIEIMADEYAKLMNVEAKMVIDKMWTGTQYFQQKFKKKRERKNKFKKLIGEN